MYYKQQIIRRNNEFSYKEFKLTEKIPEHVSETRLKESIFFEKNQRHICRTELNEIKMVSDKAILISFVNSEEEKDKNKKNFSKNSKYF